MGIFSKRKKVEENVIQAPRRSKTRQKTEVEVTKNIEEVIEVLEDGQYVEEVIEKEKVEKVTVEVEKKPQKKKKVEGSTQPRGRRIIVENREYYQKAYFHAIRLCFVIACVLFVSVGANIYQAQSTPQPLYFASDNEMRLAPMVPLSEPQMSQGGLLNWVAESVAETFTYDFRNWKNQFDGVRDKYTKKAFSEMMGSLKNGSLAMVVEKRYVASCIATSTPIISKEGVLDGIQTWIIKVPITITYESSGGVENQQNLEAKMIVQRCDTNTNPRGVQIAQLVTKAR